ncbi:MAG: hypothetical protein Q9215_003077 [Flavoplaca cf. flavocitrina]
MSSDVADEEQMVDKASNQEGHDGRSSSGAKDDCTLPVFCLTGLTEDYFQDFWRCICSQVLTLTFIGSDALDRGTSIEDTFAGIDSPFLDTSVEKVYEIFKTNISAPDDNAMDRPFTHFTCVMIDQECIDSAPYQCIVCSDAPDFGEAAGANMLKSMRLPLEVAAPVLVPLEQLFMTASEAIDSDSDCLYSMPPCTVKRGHYRDGRHLLATPAESRRQKERAIKLFIERPIPEFQKALDPARGAVLGRCPRKDAIKHSHRIRQLEGLARREGASVSFESNPSEEARLDIQKSFDEERSLTERLERETEGWLSQGWVRDGWLR